MLNDVRETRSNPNRFKLSTRGIVTAALILIGMLAILTAAASGIVTTPEITPRVFADRPLPAEWRWQKKAVEYEHMYRQTQPSRGLDWIRNSGSR